MILLAFLFIYETYIQIQRGEINVFYKISIVQSNYVIYKLNITIYFGLK